MKFEKKLEDIYIYKVVGQEHCNILKQSVCNTKNEGIVGRQFNSVLTEFGTSISSLQSQWQWTDD